MQHTNEKALFFTFPLPRTHTGVVMGNGRMGLMVWGVDGLTRDTKPGEDLLLFASGHASGPAAQ